MISRKYRRIVILLISALFGLFSTLSLPAWSNSSHRNLGNPVASASVVLSNELALDLARQGQQRYNAGQLEAAIKLWQEAAATYQKAGDRDGMTKALINQAQALQDLGLYPRACQTLLQSFEIQAPDCSPKQLDSLITTLSQQRQSLSALQAIGLQSLGDVLRKRGNLSQSQTILQLSLSRLQGTPESSAILLSLGNTSRAIGNQLRSNWSYEEITGIIDRVSQSQALAPYQEAFKNYTQAANVAAAPPTPKIQAQLNHYQLLLDIQKWWKEQAQQRIDSCSRLGETQLCRRSKQFLSQLESKLSRDSLGLQQQIEPQLATLPLSRAALYTKISFAQSLIQSDSTDSVESILTTTLQQARSLQDQRAETYTLGYLGKFYEKRGQIAQASQLTQQALMLAQEQNVSGDAREIVYLWQAQLGRLLKKQDDPKGAITAYAAAVNTLQSLRNDLSTNNQDVQFDFLQEVKPIYLELADLLLKSNLSEKELGSLGITNSGISEDKTKAKSLKTNLELAWRVIESLQLAELDSFFKDPCAEVSDVLVQIDDLDRQAAVVYPIILPDRLEVMLYMSGVPLRRVAIPVSEQQVNDTLDRLYDSLDNLTVNNSARNILATSNPNPQELRDNLQTLLPIFSQVYGWLIQPFEAQLNAKQIKQLVFVLNGRLQKVPIAALYDGQQYLIEKYGIALVPSLQLLNPKPLNGQLKVLAAGVSEPTQVQGETFTALVNVPKELAQIKETFPTSQKLLNQEFTVKAVEKQLKSNFSIVHLATHGLFSSNPQKNFIITGDGNSIGINELASLLKETDTSVELLVLSACETATGDERAILGLAGMAVRSGARSTLATLWPVGDTFTAELMGQFYQTLKKTSGKKAESLRTAQLSLLDSLRRNPPLPELRNLPPHPYYWAPYVLVGNWQ